MPTAAERWAARHATPMAGTKEAILGSEARPSQRGLSALAHRAHGAPSSLEPMEATEAYEGRSGAFGELALRVLRAGPELRELHLAHTNLTRHPDDDSLAAQPGNLPAMYHATRMGGLPSGFCRHESGRRSVRNVADLCEALKCVSGLDSADLRASRLGDSGCRIVAKLLGDSHGPPLQQLELGDNGLTDTAVSELARALRRNGTLAHLGLDGNRIGSAGAEELAAVLAVSQSLISLSLARNERIGAKGVAALAASLPDSMPLARLDLQRCGAGRGGSTIAVRALENSFASPLPPTLKEVLLAGNGFGPEQRKALWAALARGRQILELDLDDAGTGYSRAHLQQTRKDQGVQNEPRTSEVGFGLSMHPTSEGVHGNFGSTKMALQTQCTMSYTADIEEGSNMCASEHNGGAGLESLEADTRSTRETTTARGSYPPVSAANAARLPKEDVNDPDLLSWSATGW